MTSPVADDPPSAESVTGRPGPTDPRALVMLVTGSGPGPCAPAPTVMRELSRRWCASVLCVHVEDPTAELVEAFSVSQVPLWLGFELDPAPGASAAAPGATGSADVVRGARLRSLIAGQPGVVVLPVQDGDALDALSGAPDWRLVHRVTGARPKHEIHDLFGPT